MGLINSEKRKAFKKFEKKMLLLEILKEEFGIEISDLAYLHEALSIVKQLSKNQEVKKEKIEPTDEMKKKFKEAETKMTPEEFISQFGGESEEFYPYGKPKANNN